MRREKDQPVTRRQRKTVEVIGVPGGGLGQAARCSRHCLCLVEGVEGASPAIADKNDLLKAPLRLEELHPRRDIRQEHLVNAGDVVVGPPPLLAKCGIAPFQQIRNRVVTAHVATRVHETHHRFLSASGIEHASRFATILRPERDDLIQGASREGVKRDKTRTSCRIPRDACQCHFSPPYAIGQLPKM